MTTIYVLILAAFIDGQVIASEVTTKPLGLAECMAFSEQVTVELRDEKAPYTVMCVPINRVPK